MMELNSYNTPAVIYTWCILQIRPLCTLYDAVIWSYTRLLSAGTNEDLIIKVIVEHDNSQRQAIKTTYKSLFGRVR